MIKFFITFVLSIFWLTSQAQKEDRMSIGAHLHPGFSKFTGGFSNQFNLRFCYNAGINFRYQFKQTGIYLETGLGWNEYGYSNQIVFTDNLGNPINNAKITETYFMASLPLNLIYKLKNFTFSTGPLLSYYVGRKFVVKSTSQETSKIWDREILEDIHYALNFKIGYEIALGEPWLLGIEAFSNWMPSSNLYNFGIGLSARYKLGHDRIPEPSGISE